MWTYLEGAVEDEAGRGGRPLTGVEQEQVVANVLEAEALPADSHLGKQEGGIRH